MKLMKSVLMLTLFCASTQAFAFDCVALKDGEIRVQLQGDSSKSAVIDSYQLDVIEVDANNLVLIIFDRRTPTSSARAVISGRVPGQIVASQLETADGSYQIRCK